MKAHTLIAATTFFAGLAASPAPLASAEPPAAADDTKMNGVYHYADEDGDIGTWTINTTCKQVCVAHVSTGPGQGFNAPLIDGQYTVTRTIPEAAICANDSSLHPVHVHQSWDPLTLTGVAVFLDSAAPCGLTDPHDAFTLTKIG
ncbi:hypothetical protein [Mycobacterium genavense]|uniref:hypothetical protein n=1 Tax=Mycobacterium genavense TaxID=36812 RepID=UPI00046EDCA5|nr:hypothetical protein [Mycobacterium genavense]